MSLDGKALVTNTRDAHPSLAEGRVLSQNNMSGKTRIQITMSRIIFEKVENAFD